jgi:hypothetical protein
MNIHPIPVTRNFTSANILSLIIVLLMGSFSISGLLFQSLVYPSEALRRSFVSNDIVNLCIGLPILLGSIVLAHRGSLIGLLFWPGALFYVTYNYIAYAFARTFDVKSGLYLALVVLSIYAIFRILRNGDPVAIQKHLAGKVPERFAGGVLVGLGVLFFLRSIGQVAQTFSGQIQLSGPDLAVLVADLLITPTWVISGVLLWRHKAFGYVIGPGLLFQASMLFVSLLIFLIFQPILTAAPFPAQDFAVIFGMGLVCFIPFGLFLRGIVNQDL